MEKATWIKCLVGISALLMALSGPAPASDLESYTVREGESLWSISGSVLHDPYRWTDLAAANPEIADADHIEAGQVLRLPLREGSNETAATRNSSLPLSGVTVSLTPSPTETQPIVATTPPSVTPTPQTDVSENAPRGTEAERLFSPASALSRSLLEKGLHHLREASRAIEASRAVQPLEHLDYRKLLDHTGYLDRQLNEFLVPLLKEREEAYRITIDNAYFGDSLRETLKGMDQAPLSERGGGIGKP